MSFNSVSKSATPAASNAKNLAKKKRGKKSAKSRQGKLDVRRQQLLSQVKNKGCEEESIGGGEMHVPPMHEGNGRDQGTRALEVTPTNGEKDGTMHNGIDLDSSSNNANSQTETVVESNSSGTNFSASTRSCSSGTSYSRNISQVEDDGGLDDWEAVADALAAIDDKKDQCDQKLDSFVENQNVAQSDHLSQVVKPPTSNVDVWEKPEKRNQKYKSLVENKNATQLDHLPEVVNQPAAVVDVWKKKPENGQAWRRGDAFHWKPRTYKKRVQKSVWVENKNITQLDHLPVKQPTATVDVSKPKPANGQAWKRNDAFRPKSLPNLQKNVVNSYPMKANRHYRNGGTTLGCKNFVSPPSSCPICCEDMDSTDSSFLPCSCGFQLCLFCHKRILEEDGRCPGCRKHYDNNAV